MEKQLQSVLSKKKKTTKPSNKYKQKNSNQAAVKVVYVSNPMKVKICASKFRALVQELTGRDADPSKFAEDNQDHDVGGGSSTQTTVVDDATKLNSSSLPNEADSQEAKEGEEEEYSTTVGDDVLSGSVRSGLDFQAAFVDDDLFMPQTTTMMMNMDNFSIDSLVPPSNFELNDASSSGHENQMMF